MFNLFNGWKKKQPPVCYTQEEKDALARFVERSFGEAEEFLEEVSAENIRVDIYVIPPRGEDDCYTLVTQGMGARRMDVPEDDEACRALAHAELVMCLPRTWNMRSGSPRWRWPMEMLRCLAHTPMVCDTWLGSGHTVDFGEIFARETRFSAAMLLACLGHDHQPLRCTLPEGKIINYYQVVPLYANERDFAEEEGPAALLDQAEQHAFAPKVFVGPVNPERPCMLESDLLDLSDDHQETLESKQLPVDTLAACSHLAIFLRWMIEHDLLCEDFLLTHEEVLRAVRQGRYAGDLRVFMNYKLQGCLLGRFFSAEGQAFAAWYYHFDPEEDQHCYPADVDAYALAYFGEEKYNSEEFQDEAYLFVPWDESYYRGLARVIDEKYRLWKAQR